MFPDPRLDRLKHAFEDIRELRREGGGGAGPGPSGPQVKTAQPAAFSRAANCSHSKKSAGLLLNRKSMNVSASGA